ncbi:phasin family protein [Oscillatoriales cyanobacterium LEGE 11467]|uniref:Phasin family protein n=1 Tax=Zarconia navalis LEGE 11467 TaxID=1828826 RepID=A0A928Z8G2_9CYAN|nr:phasin family protein [Zarconia navalis]MBE9042457.1 phasin family protein [Zarconia navalis LEGE 11467]
MDNNDIIKQLLMFGIGTTSLVTEKLREVSDRWVREGTIDSEQATNFVDELMGQIESEQGNVRHYAEQQIRNIMQDLGVSRQKEVDELRGRIDRLERQVRELENKRWR